MAMQRRQIHRPLPEHTKSRAIATGYQAGGVLLGKMSRPSRCFRRCPGQGVDGRAHARPSVQEALKEPHVAAALPMPCGGATAQC